MKHDLETPGAYIPYIISNGDDAIMVTYSGAMVCGATGHTHNEQHQGCVCGWYRESHRDHLDRLLPIVIGGYQVEIDGEICEPTWYEQELAPSTGIITSHVRFRCDTLIKMETYLSPSGIFCIDFLVESAPAGCGLGYLALSPNQYGGTMTVHTEPVIECNATERGITFTYDLGSGVTGTGLLWSNRTDWFSKEYAGSRSMGLLHQISSGWKGSMRLQCIDAGTSGADISSLELRKETTDWYQTYFQTSNITLPDSRLQSLYDVSRFVLKGNQNKRGSMTCGPMPHQWNGGTCVPFDSNTMQLALLETGNITEGRHHLDFYLDKFDEGRRLADEIGFGGFAFSNWCTITGKHLGNDLTNALKKKKPVMIAYIGIAAANCLHYGNPDDCEAKKLLIACADFIENGFVHDGHISDCSAQNESYRDVSRDSLLLSLTCKLFYECETLCGDIRRGNLGRTLLAELEKNRREDGVIMPYSDAVYTAGLGIYYAQLLPELFSIQQLQAIEKAMATPWGLDNDQPSEVYRHWPWNTSQLSACYSRAGACKDAFRLLKHCTDYASFTGAIPEKVRLDGYIIGYWYTTAHGCLIQAVHDAFVNRTPEGALRILPGFDGTWKDFSCHGLCLKGGLSVSLTVSSGSLTHLVITNSRSVCTINLEINSAYYGIKRQQATLLSGKNNIIGD